MAKYNYKYLEVTEKPTNTGKVIKRVDVSDLTYKAMNKKWDELEAFIDDETHACVLVESQTEKRCIN